jgi:hypothetical protein
MTETAEPFVKFHMIGTRAALITGPTIESIEQQVMAIENALERVPDFAFDLSKTLVETMCKTILTDMGQPPNSNWDCPRLLRETTDRLSLLPLGHPNGKATRESITKTINGLLQTIQGLCELRKNFGLASHGRDAFSARLGLRQAMLAAQAADTIASFIYVLHRDASNQSPRDRVYYADHKDFNTAFDQSNEVVRIGNLELLPSRVLFHTDPAAYRSALIEFISEPDDSPPPTATDIANQGGP